MGEEKEKEKKIKCKHSGGHGGSAVYGLGFIGALIYFFQHAINFWGYVIGFLKALVWPAFLVYEALRLLRM